MQVLAAIMMKSSQPEKAVRSESCPTPFLMKRGHLFPQRLASVTRVQAELKPIKKAVWSLKTVNANSG